MTPDLPPMDVRGRASRLRGRFPEVGIDALVVTHLPNIRYLTGFTGSAAVLVVGSDDLVFVTDGRYQDQAAEQLAATGIEAVVVVRATQAEQRRALMDAVKPFPRLGLEAHAVTWAQQREWCEAFTTNLLVPTVGEVEALRRVKERGEVERIRYACGIADDALGELLPTLSQQPTEREFALELEVAMRRRGATGTSFPTIVASGPNGAKPHSRPTERPIERRELVVIDFGCVVDGYCSDMTRTVSVGDPGPEARHVWDVVLASQQAGRDAVRAGVTCQAIDSASREVIEAAGLGDRFTHSTGHGVGLEIHEAPRVARTVGDTVAPGYVVTVEPGVYLPGVGGVRIEDTVVVTDKGSNPLTAFPKELVV